MARFEYKFVRIGEGRFGAKKEAQNGYQDIIAEHARNGWRLVQIFAPVVATGGYARYYELILEKERS